MFPKTNLFIQTPEFKEPNPNNNSNTTNSNNFSHGQDKLAKSNSLFGDKAINTNIQKNLFGATANPVSTQPSWFLSVPNANPQICTPMQLGNSNHEGQSSKMFKSPKKTIAKTNNTTKVGSFEPKVTISNPSSSDIHIGATNNSTNSTANVQPGWSIFGANQSNLPNNNNLTSNVVGTASPYSGVQTQANNAGSNKMANVFINNANTVSPSNPFANHFKKMQTSNPATAQPCNSSLTPTFPLPAVNNPPNPVVFPIPPNLPTGIHPVQTKTYEQPTLFKTETANSANIQPWPAAIQNQYVANNQNHQFNQPTTNNQPITNLHNTTTHPQSVIPPPKTAESVSSQPKDPIETQFDNCNLTVGEFIDEFRSTFLQTSSDLQMLSDFTIKYMQQHEQNKRIAHNFSILEPIVLNGSDHIIKSLEQMENQQNQIERAIAMMQSRLEGSRYVHQLSTYMQQYQVMSEELQELQSKQGDRTQISGNNELISLIFESLNNVELSIREMDEQVDRYMGSFRNRMSDY